jgi:hypothetical protein
MHYCRGLLTSAIYAPHFCTNKQYIMHQIHSTGCRLIMRRSHAEKTCRCSTISDRFHVHIAWKSAEWKDVVQNNWTVMYSLCQGPQGAEGCAGVRDGGADSRPRPDLGDWRDFGPCKHPMTPLFPLSQVALKNLRRLVLWWEQPTSPSARNSQTLI